MVLVCYDPLVAEGKPRDDSESEAGSVDDVEESPEELQEYEEDLEAPHDRVVKKPRGRKQVKRRRKQVKRRRYHVKRRRNLGARLVTPNRRRGTGRRRGTWWR